MSIILIAACVLICYRAKDRQGRALWFLAGMAAGITALTILLSMIVPHMYPYAP